MIWAMAGLFLVCVYLLIENIKLKKELNRNHPYIQSKYNEAKKLEGLWDTAKRHSENYAKFFNLSNKDLELISNKSTFYKLFETKIDNITCHIYVQQVCAVDYGVSWTTVLMAKLFGENDSDYQTKCRGIAPSEFSVLTEEYHEKLLYQIRISELESLAENKKKENKNVFIM